MTTRPTDSEPTTQQHRQPLAHYWVPQRSHREWNHDPRLLTLACALCAATTIIEYTSGIAWWETPHQQPCCVIHLSRRPHYRGWKVEQNDPGTARCGITQGWQKKLDPYYYGGDRIYLVDRLRHEPYVGPDPEDWLPSSERITPVEPGRQPRGPRPVRVNCPDCAYLHQHDKKSKRDATPKPSIRPSRPEAAWNIDLTLEWKP